MIRLLIWLLLIYVGYRVVMAMVAGKKKTDVSGPRSVAAPTHRDPVCGVYVSEDDAVIGRHGGERHYFCSMNCLEKYRQQLDHTHS